MSMDLEKKTFSTQPDYLIAGNAEIVTATKQAAAAVQRGTVAALNAEGKVEAVTADTTAAIYGIVAEAAEAGEDAIVYLSGQFFADALVLAEGVTAADVEVALRNIGIFLK